MTDEVIEEVKTKFALFSCSAKALLKIDADRVGSGEISPSSANSKYPFSEMKIGQSFAIDFTELETGTIQSLRSLVTKQFKLKLRRFAVIVHKDLQVVEVARIA